MSEFNISLGDGVEFGKLPNSFLLYDMPWVKWEVPWGVEQYKFNIELKTVLPVALTSGDIGYAYFNSGLVTTSSSFFQVPFLLEPLVWLGAIEIRIRILDDKNRIISCTHDAYNGVYDFESNQEVVVWDDATGGYIKRSIPPQYLEWNSSNDGCYFVLEQNAAMYSSNAGMSFSWTAALNYEVGQTIGYELQISDTPLFGVGDIKNTTRVIETSETSYVDNDLVIDKPYFLRVRSFDGYDYSGWSIIRSFTAYYNAKPACSITGVVTTRGSRESGEVYVSGVVTDAEQNYVTVELMHSFTDYALNINNSIDAAQMNRCPLSSSPIRIPVGEPFELVWNSVVNLRNALVENAWLYMRAWDGVEFGVVSTYGPFEINNIGKGVGGGDINLIDFWIRNRINRLKTTVFIPQEKYLDGFITDWQSYVDSSLGVTNFPDGVIENDISYKVVEGLPFQNYRLVGDGKKQRHYLYHGHNSNKNDTWLKDELQLIYWTEHKYDILRSAGYNDLQIEAGDYDSALLEGESFMMAYWTGEEPNPLQLGMGDKYAFYGLSKRPDFEPYFLLHRPRVGGSYGVYTDGPGLNGNVQDYGKYLLPDSGDVGGTNAGESPKGELWKNMYGLHPFFVRGDNSKPTEFIVARQGQANIYESNVAGINKEIWFLFLLPFSISFPMYITRGENDAFSFLLNGVTYSGSVLSDGVDFESIEFPYSYLNGTWQLNVDRAARVLALLNKLFNYGDYFGQRINDSYREFYDLSQFSISSSAFLIGGNLVGMPAPYHTTFEVVGTENSCYEQLGINPCLLTFGRSIYNSTKNDLGVNYYTFKYGATVASEEEEIYELVPETGFNYGYRMSDNEDELERLTQALHYNVTSSETDGAVKQSLVPWLGANSAGDTQVLWMGAWGLEDNKLIWNYDLPTDDYEPAIPPSELSMSGEPLYTCSLDDVDKEGFHFRYSLSRFLQTGKVYVRVYKTVECNPYPDPTFGYRNWITVPVRDRAGIYRRVVVKKQRGLPPLLTSVVLEDGTMDTAWSVPQGEIFSHEFLNKDVPSLGYKRIEPSEWLDKLARKTCLVTEYRDYTSAFYRSYIDRGNNNEYGPLSAHSVFAYRCAIDSGYYQYLYGAYMPSSLQNIIADDLIKYNSVVESSATGNYGRYQNNWYDNDTSLGGNKGVFVDQSALLPSSRVDIQKVFAYIPENTFENYCKVDDDANVNNRYLPAWSQYVHGITKDGSNNLGVDGSVIVETIAVSNNTLNKFTADNYREFEFWDYRLRGGVVGEWINYFSAMPRSEHIDYSFRPDAVYAEDRPWRIGGIVEHLRDIVSWRFIYLQNEWNAYNQIHWRGNPSENSHVHLEALSVDSFGNAIGDWFSVRTKTAEWFEQYGWLIPYNDGRECDMLDNLNNDDFVMNAYYRLRISSVDTYNNVVGENSLISQIVMISDDSPSPPIITNLEYLPWTQTVEITFRFDDVRGRKYNITDFSYSVDDGYTLINDGYRYLTGDLRNLSSNIRGDDVNSELLIIKHKASIPISQLNISSGPSFSVYLTAELTDNEAVVDYPVFFFKTWGNELLKMAEDTIWRIGGKKNRWQYVEEANDIGGYDAKWVYLQKEDAITQPGQLQQLDEQITNLDNAFNLYYSQWAKYEHPCIDARLNYLKINNFGNSYYVFCVRGFLEWRSLLADYLQFILGSLKEEYYLCLEYVQKSGLHYDLLDYQRRAKYILVNGFYDSKPGLNEDFLDWFASHKAISLYDSKINYLLSSTGITDEYVAWLPTVSLTDTDEARTRFIKEKYESQFFTYYATTNTFADGVFASMNNWINETTVVYGETNVLLRTIFDDWLLNDHIDYYGNDVAFDYLDGYSGISGESYTYDQYAIFIDYLYANSIVSDGSFEAQLYNEGLVLARSRFMSFSENGVTNNSRYRALLDERTALLSELNESYVEKNRLEVEHRQRLIMQGFFNNGFIENRPYKDDGSINVAFRFRVENKPISGNLSSVDVQDDFDPTSTADEVTPVAGYEDRFDVYYHFQLDFYDTFNSQGGVPLRDYLYALASETGTAGDIKIIGGSAYTRISAGIIGEGGMSVMPGSVFTSSDGKIAVADPYDFQFRGQFSIITDELPGKLGIDVLPDAFNDASRQQSKLWEQSYFWRIAMYNVVKRDVWECLAGLSTTPDYIGVDSGGNPVYEIVISNTFRTGIVESYIGDRTVGYYSQYVYNAYALRDNPVWLYDYSDGTLAEFSHDRSCEWFDSELVNQNRLRRGEVCFLTDRPRSAVQMESDSSSSSSIETALNFNRNWKEVNGWALNYIDDDNENFLTQWVPFSVDRERPSVIFDSSSNEYILFASKTYKVTEVGGSELERKVITISRGFNPVIFGEEVVTFPRLSGTDTSDVIIRDVVFSGNQQHLGALSFERPAVVLVQGEYCLYFNTLFHSPTVGYFTEVYVSKSTDLSEWSEPQIISGLQNVYDLNAVYEDGSYRFFGISSTNQHEIVGWTSLDGITLENRTVVYSTINIVGSPCFVSYRRQTAYNGETTTAAFVDECRLFYTEKMGAVSRIRSTKRLVDGGGTTTDTFEGEALSQIEIGYGCGNDDEPWVSSDKYYNPCVIVDNDMGCSVLRLFYNEPAKPYLYVNKQLQEFGDDFYSEAVIKTAYLDEYKWAKIYYDQEYSPLNIAGDSIPVAEANGTNISFSRYSLPLLPCSDSGVDVILRYRTQGVTGDNGLRSYAVKLPIKPTASEIECRSESAWIDWNNVGLTAAQLSPQYSEDGYSFSEYGIEQYLDIGNLKADYYVWKNDNEGLYNTDNEWMTGFLVSIGKYGDYQTWAYRGPGIYTHKTILERKSYAGDGKNVDYFGNPI